MVPNFFILGLPRSRTLWFTEFFCTGACECVHEHFSSHQAAELIPGVRGYSDTNPLTVPDYGESPVLIIDRDLADVVSSCLNAFDKPDGVLNWPATVNNYMSVYKNALDKLEPKNVMRVNYNCINVLLREIWEFLLPDIPVDEQRIDFFKHKIVKTENRDIKESLIRTFGTIDNFAQQFDPEALRTFRITDYAITQKIMSECWYEVSEDNAPDYLPDIVKEYWVGLAANGVVIGCYRFHQINGVTWQGHAFMLKQYRKDYSVRSAECMYRWMLRNTDFKKLIVIVPSKFKNVLRFIENIGFKQEGINRKSFNKDDILWDLIHFGLTRAEIEGLL